MKTIKELAQDWANNRIAILLDEAQLTNCIIQAAREYAAWGNLDETRIDDDCGLTASQCGVIMPFAYLLAEKEMATMQEATRGLSHEVYGRNVSEIVADIVRFREESLRKWAFCKLPESI